MRGINIGENVYIGYDVIFDRIHPEKITMSDYAEIGDRCIISAHKRGTKPLLYKYPRRVKPVRIDVENESSRITAEGLLPPPSSKNPACPFQPNFAINKKYMCI